MASPYLEVEIEPVKPEQVIRKTRDWEVAYTTVGVDVQKNRLEYGVYQFDKSPSEQAPGAPGRDSPD